MIGNPEMTNSMEGIAVIGMAVNVPGANNLEEFWENLKAGVESISILSDEELAASGVEIKSIKHNPRYVRAAGILQNVEWFDAAFFGVNPREGELMDPQHRLLLECSWRALEDAGYDSESFRGSIGVYVGMNKASYLLSNLVPHGNTISPLAPNQTELLNERDFLSTRISYKLNLKGPSINVQTACSTSLVAIVMGYQGLLNYQCDMALAGGVCVRVPHRQGYWYEETGVASPDGHCRPFDEHAQGTVGGSGAGVVVLKRLADAIADVDNIYAVIKGAAINNDGAAKLSYTAPSVDGQAEVVAMAQAVAGVEPETISYVECHGTGTPLGDPIEIAGLTQAFRAGTNAKNFCAIGSVKSNFGHLDTAAGVAGFIKTSLSLQRKLLPPSLHYKSPNPKCHFETTPFYLNDRLTEWKAATTPRRAGVSSFGFGGTNAHAVLEEAPLTAPSSPSRSWQLLQLSAKTGTALEAATANLVKWFKQNPESNLADAAYTLKIGRRGFDYRRIVVCQNLQDATTVLQTLDRARVHTRHQEHRNTPVAFMFPGQGSQYVNMGRELYLNEPVFRRELERCAELLEPSLGCELLRVMYPEESKIHEATEQLTQTFLAQPAIFAIEYSLAKLWMEWGICPEMMIGHSVGEFVAACLAGVFSLKEALQLVASRGRLIQALPPGTMLAVPLSEKEVSQFLGKDLALAAVNGPLSCVVSGSREAVDALERQLVQSEKAPRHLHTSHAFHSAMMDPILETFEEEVRKVRLRPPTIPFVSCLTGTRITPDEATQPSYWVRHLRQTVRFSEGLDVLMQEPPRAMLEVGPGQTLSTFAKRHPALGKEHTVLSTLRHAQEETSDVAFLLNSLGRLWLAGVKIDWPKFYDGERRQRIPLPTYPFERKRFWIDPPQNGNRLLIAPSDENHREATVTEAQELLPGPNAECALHCLNAVPSVATSRRERILEELISITHELSGIEPGALDVHTTFLELGFDSLFLTQANTEFRKKFEVKITFRQLLNEAPTLFSLAEFIDSKLPPEVSPEKAGPPLMPDPLVQPIPKESSSTEVFSASSQPFTPGMTELTKAAAQARESVSALERLIHEKLWAMSQVDPMGRGQSGTTGPPASNATPPITSVQGPGTDESASPSSKTSNRLADGRANEQQSGESKQRPFGPWKPIDSSPVEGLDSSKQKHLHNLITRYTARTSKSKELTQLYRPRLADPRAVAGFRTAWKEMVYPIVVARSSGSKIWDVDGNEYVDITLGFGSNLFGHSPEFVTRALEEQIRKDMAIGPQSTLAGEVAQSICELTGVERVSFCNTGSEAVLASLRVARTTTGRNKIALFSGAYHGIFDEVLVKSSPTGSKLRPIPIAPGIPQHMVQDVLVLEYGNPESIKILQEHTEELAAVLVEPVQSRRPELQPREFLHVLREWTERSGVVLIFDEMITGFRLHPGGAQAWFNVRADLATYGKVIGGGMPIGVVGGKAPLMDALDGGMWNYGDASFPEVGVTYFAGTFVRHPLALAASLSVLNHLRDSGPDLQQRLNERATRFASDLNQHFQSTGAPIHIQSCGSMFHWEFIDDQKFAGLFFFHLREKGIHVWDGRPFFISTAHTNEDLTFVARAIKESVAEMQAAGYLPRPAGAVEVKRELAPDGVKPSSSLPLTEAQRELWLAAQMGDDASGAFVDSVALVLRGPLQIAALHKTIHELVARHDSLRTTFSDNGEEQYVAPAMPLEIPFSDLSDLKPNEGKERLAEIATGESREPFNLSRGPLLRAHIVKLGDKHHVLLLTTHHIVVDGWSLGVLLSELGVIYSAESSGQANGLQTPAQFVDYVRWQASQQGEAAGAASETYWLEQFKESAPLLELPADRPRPAVKTYTAALQHIVLPLSLCRDLRRVAARRSATLFATLLAGFNILLHHLTGQEDIVVGVPAAGQLAIDGRDLVGHCVNFLPLRSRINGSVEYLATVKSLVLDAYDHQNYTYGSLLQKLKLPRAPSRLPLVSVTFNLDRGGAKPEFDGLDVEISVQPKSVINFDSQINIVEEGSELKVKWHYNTDLFDAGTIQRWLRHYQTLLQGIAANPEERLPHLPILSDAEKQQLLSEWNDTKRDYPKDKCIHELFEAQVDRSPEAVAVVFKNKKLTYRELNRQANQLAHYLQKLGVGPEVLVGVCMERSVETLVGVLGILKAGGAYVPVDPGYPKERVALMLQDAGVEVLLTEQKLQERLPEFTQLDTETGRATVPYRRVLLDTNWSAIDREGVENPASWSKAHNLAYVLYTSGSTGQPKGVVIEHRSLVNYLCWVNEVLFAGKDVNLPVMSRLSFDASLKQMLAPLLRGGAVWFLPDDLRLQPRLLLEVLGGHERVGFNCVPSLWKELLDTLTVDSNLASQLDRRLSRLYLGGESLDPDLVTKSFAVLPNLELWNLYGPTEGTANATAGRIRPGEHPSMGRPIANAQIYVLDPNLRPVPVGVAAELYLGGVGLARGYLNRPDLTAERFVPSPFEFGAGARLYRTGDLAKFRADGSLDFLGRKDEQVKVRGYRIELGEIEAALRVHSQVREALVICREDAGEKRLVAYFTVNKEGTSIRELRNFLKNRVPEYMVPTAFVRMDKLPLTANGKVDRRALPEPGNSGLELIEGYVAPSTPIEKALAEMWIQLLGVEKVSIHDNFFELGGHSLLAMQLIRRVRNSFRIELPVRSIFEAPTLAGLEMVVLDLLIEQTKREETTQILSALRDS